MSTSLTAIAMRAATRSLAVAAKRKAAAPLSAPSWRMEGEGFALEEIRPGLWRATFDPADPVRLRHIPSGRCICPPFREMETDLASVPAVLSRLAAPVPALHLRQDAFPRTACFHDALYDAAWCWVIEAGHASRAPVTRAQADAILYIGLACEGATVADGIAYHSGVRIGGASHWAASRQHPQTWPPLFVQSGITT